MGQDGCLKKCTDLRKTSQGGKVVLKMLSKKKKQAGAELCQAQAQLG